jgi:hypothetical protein
MKPRFFAVIIAAAIAWPAGIGFGESYDPSLDSAADFSARAFRGDSYESMKSFSSKALEGNLVAEPSPVYVVFPEGSGSGKQWVGYDLTSPSSLPAFVVPEPGNSGRRHYIDDPKPPKKGAGFLTTMFETALGTVLPPFVKAGKGLVEGAVFGFVTGFVPGALIGGILGAAKGLVVGTVKGAMNLVGGTAKALWGLFHGRLL